MLVAKLPLAEAQTPFECDGTFYMNIGTLAQNGIHVVALDSSNLSMDTVSSTTTINRNILAFNYADSFIYSVHFTNYNVYRVDSAGNHTNLGAITGISGSVPMNTGDFDQNGILVISGHPTNSNIYRIDVTTTPPSVISSAARTFSSGSGLPGFADYAYNRKDGKFYGVETTTQKLTEIDPLTGVVTPVSSNTAGLIIGATFFGPDYEQLYVYGRYPSESLSSRLFRCDITTGLCTFIGQGIASDNIDGCSCNPSCDTSLVVITDSVCQGGSYDFFGSTYDSVGEYAEVFTSVGGCDSSFRLELSLFELPSTQLQPFFACHGDSQLIFGQYRNTAGFYYDTLSTVQGCDSVLQRALIINSTEYTTLADAEHCIGDSSLVFGEYQHAAATYSDTLISSNGCDSILSQTLIVHNPVQVALPAVEHCQGDSTVIFGEHRFAAGVYYDTLNTVNGCDSVITQSLVVNPTSQVTLPVIMHCEGDSSFIFGELESVGGIYFDTLSTVYGCDSVLIQELIVHENVQTTLPTVAHCEGDSTLIFGQYQTSTGIYYDTLNTIHGCDSVLIQELLVNSVYQTLMSPVIHCDGDSSLIFGQFQFAAGIYMDTMSTTLGCDSVLVQELLVYGATETTLIDVEYCQGDSVLIFGQFQSAPGVYNDTLSTIYGCDSVLIQSLIVHQTDQTNLGELMFCEGGSVEVFGELRSDVGFFRDTLSNVEGCDSILVVEVSYYEQPEAMLDVVEESCPDQFDGSITATGVSGELPLSYTWNTGSFDSKIDGLAASTYTITVTDAHNCISIQEVILGLDEQICPGVDAWLPNIFSPNGDGQNDVLYAEGRNIASLQMTIFDRWGHVVFESFSQQQGWDGTSNGALVDPGTYIYMVRIVDTLGIEARLNGNITLIR